MEVSDRRACKAGEAVVVDHSAPRSGLSSSIAISECDRGRSAATRPQPSRGVDGDHAGIGVSPRVLLLVQVEDAPSIPAFRVQRVAGARLADWRMRPYVLGCCCSRAHRPTPNTRTTPLAILVRPTRERAADRANPASGRDSTRAVPSARVIARIFGTCSPSAMGWGDQGEGSATEIAKRRRATGRQKLVEQAGQGWLAEERSDRGHRDPH